MQYLYWHFPDGVFQWQYIKEILWYINVFKSILFKNVRSPICWVCIVLGWDFIILVSFLFMDFSTNGLTMQLIPQTLGNLLLNLLPVKDWLTESVTQWLSDCSTRRLILQEIDCWLSGQPTCRLTVSVTDWLRHWLASWWTDSQTH